MRFKRLRYIKVAEGKRLKIENYPSIHYTGSLSGMRELYWRHDPYQIRSGNYIYNVPKYIYNSI